MEQALEKIRPHTSSSLAHQKAPATLLRALEATLDDQGTPKTSTAYFASLLTALDGTLHREGPSETPLGEGDVLPAELYLLSLVIPFVPHPVIRTHLNTILSLTAPLWSRLYPHAPALRSQLGLYGAAMLALDRSQLDLAATRQSFASILQLAVDSRPKVRRKAAEVVRDVLDNPPNPLLRHPYAEKVAEWVLNALAEANAVPFFKKQNRKQDAAAGSEASVHLLAFVRMILLNLPSATLAPIATSLLSLPRLGDPYLSQSAYSILSELLSAPTDDVDEAVTSQIPNIIKAILSSPPTKSDISLCSTWLRVLCTSMVALSHTDPQTCVTDLGKVWKVVWAFLESDVAATRRAAAESLGMLTQCFTADFVQAAAAETKRAGEVQHTLRRMIEQAEKALDSLAMAPAMPELHSAVASIVSHLRPSYEPDAIRTAENLAAGLITKVGGLRTQRGFEFKENVDAVLSAAMQTIGPEALLRLLPLNLEPADRQAGREPRAFLLTLLPQPHPSPLTHFLSYFVPLSERMFEYQQKAEDEGRQSEAKVWNVLVAQIWAGLVGYCYGGGDLKQALTPAFSALLSQLLYSQEELRPAVLRALKVLVDSNLAYSSEAEGRFANLPAAAKTHPLSAEAASANVAFLRTQSASWLSVLFNVYASMDRDARGPVSEVITAWAGIAGEQEVTKSYQKVIELFDQNFGKSKPNYHGPETSSVAATSLEIMSILVPFLSKPSANELFQRCLRAEVLGSSEVAVQKRAYKVVTRLVASGEVDVNAEAVLAQLGAVSDSLHAAAKKDRYILISLLVKALPPTGLHVLPSLIVEAVLGTKEPAEKARTAAFELIVAMGLKMNEGGVVRRNMVDGMDEDGEGDAPANIGEFLTMLAGGLAGATPHMISATITAISRVVFEFKDVVSENMHEEIFTTLLVFLSSANREIVKSALGYVKLAVHTMPAELLRPHLAQLVPALLRWAHDHNNHFKPKVRHIFERMIRRFGFEDVYSNAGEEEAKKVLVNIKKRKDRAKRKKTARAAEDDGADEDEEPVGKEKGEDAFEDVLYGSESDIEDSEDENAPAASASRNARNTGARLRVDDDEPMDLLQGAAARISTGRTGKRRTPGQNATRYKTDDDTGKIIIQEGGDSDPEVDAARAQTNVAGTAYRESLTSADGFTRGRGGRVKFNKDTKKRRRDEEDVEMADADDQGDATPPKKVAARRDRKLGHEFKAKKAGGDVKKGGVDPFAYLPLSQAAKKKSGKGGRIGIVGKR